MITIDGHYAKGVKIFTDDIEDEAMSLIYNIANNAVFKDTKIRIMPDTHAGKGIVIGFTTPVGDYVSPAHVGCDIGCGMHSIFFDKPLDPKDYALFEHRVKKEIPMGFNIHNNSVFEMKDFIKFVNKELMKAYQSSNHRIKFVEFKKEKDIKEWCDWVEMDFSVFCHSIGTVGGGNHFLEYDEGDGHYAFTCHTGSRNLGVKVFKKWDKIANSTEISKLGMKKVVHDVKRNYTGPLNGIKEAIDKALDEYKLTLHPGYLEGADLEGYLTDMVIAQAYAKYNRKIICDRVEKIYNKIAKSKKIEDIECIHNYICFDDMIVRKGSIRSYEGEKMIIPFNMRDGLAICEGKSNEDWNYSAPHGAGRKMSRSAAKRELNVDEFIQSMKDAGIYTTTANAQTIDESPEAYKPMDEIIENIKPTAKILFMMKPKINLKAAEKSEYVSGKSK